MKKDIWDWFGEKKEEEGNYLLLYLKHYEVNQKMFPVQNCRLLYNHDITLSMAFNLQNTKLSFIILLSFYQSFHSLYLTHKKFWKHLIQDNNKVIA